MILGHSFLRRDVAEHPILLFRPRASFVSGGSGSKDARKAAQLDSSIFLLTKEVLSTCSPTDFAQDPSFWSVDHRVGFAPKRVTKKGVTRNGETNKCQGE
jgi:hypothetical protein